MGRYEGGYIGARPEWDSANRTGLWTPQSVFQRQNNRLWIKSNDPYINNVVAHLKFDGEAGGTTYIDDGILNLPIENIGTTKVTTTTSVKKYGVGSGSFPTTQGYLSINHPNLALGTGQYTIEFWLYSTAFRSNNGILSSGNSNSTFTLILSVLSNGLLVLGASTGYQIPLNTWTHIALVREHISTGGFKVYVNGVKINDTTNTANMTQTFFNIGVYYSISHCWGGLLDSFRITKGVARYTTNFNPETDTYLAY